jgi:flagellar hook capping protein FlgD
VYQQPLPSASLFAYERDLARDVLPAGSGNLASRTARFDAHVIEPGGSFQDNLFVYTDYNPEPSRVDVIFRVRPGPAIDSGQFNAWLGTFPPEGNGWVSARLDTAEGRREYPPGIKWQTTFHEEDPHFIAPEELGNQIFPDNLFTPGTRVDYFFRWTTALDPSAVSLLPDTTGGHAFEMEVLPSSIVPTPQVENNSVLLIERTETYYYDTPQPMKSVVDSALAVLLPGGSANAENRAWDRFDIPFRQDLFPENLQNYYQNDPGLLGAYNTILWLSHTNTMDVGPLDSAALINWLESGSKTHPHRLYLANHSQGCCSALYQTLGVDYYRYDVHYRPETGESDNSHCIEVLAEPGAPFGAGFHQHLVSYDEAAQLTPAASTAEAIHAINLVYQMPVFGRVEAASVNTYFSQGSREWRSVVDGFSVHRLRAADDCSGSPDGAVERLGDVLAWFDADPVVPVTLLSFSGVWEGSRIVLTWSATGMPSDHVGFHVFRETEAQGRVRLTTVPVEGKIEYRFVDATAPLGGAEYWLGDMRRDGPMLWLGPYDVGGSGPTQLRVQAVRNPFSQGSGFRLELPKSAPVRIRILDVSGREVTTLQPGSLGPGFVEVAWDGRNGQGRSVPVGLYVYRVEAGSESITGKIVKVEPR